MFPWYAFLTYAVITAATPGPNNIMSMSNAGRLGFRRALPFNLGIWVGFTIVMVLCTLFCTALSGLLLQFINPKIYLYCIMSMEAYILPYYGGQPVILFLFALLLAFIGFAFTLAWAAFGSVFRLLFSRHARVVNTIMALLLVYCAVSLFL